MRLVLGVRAIPEINRGLLRFPRHTIVDKGGKQCSALSRSRAVSAAVLAFSPTAFAQQTGGTADEAKAMLMKAVAAVKADKAKALDMFNKGVGGFLDRDLYVFCDNLSDAKVRCDWQSQCQAIAWHGRKDH